MCAYSGRRTRHSRHTDTESALAQERAGLEAQGWSAVGGEARNGSSAAQQDASPPRRKRQRHDSPDTSPPRRQRHDTPDASPPRLQQQGSPDASPPRRRRHNSPDASPPRRRRHDSPDASPPRRRRHDSSSASPPHRAQVSTHCWPICSFEYRVRVRVLRLACMNTAEGIRERLSLRDAATIVMWRCRLSRMTRMPVCPGGGQQQKHLPTPALRAGARLP